MLVQYHQLVANSVGINWNPEFALFSQVDVDLQTS